MARGKSGRLVIEIDPKLKKELYQVLLKKDLTLKEWFLINALDFIENSDQMKLWSKQDN